MKGTSASDGRAQQGEAHLRQSIADILQTPLGSRVMRRDYGSLIPELLDQPFNTATRARLYGATAMALMRWEPRLRLTRVQLFTLDRDGAFLLRLEGSVDRVPTQITVPLGTETGGPYGN
ncbi:GPW/gp25 family protein [Microbulbifer sp. 2201CG32-9]|uniref:GPW/gp25 family protein n=1 Tax=Microbulbifer sp. 2201CG32-9 TaxID=3232309 RepID=UPI00345BEE6C